MNELIALIGSAVVPVAIAVLVAIVLGVVVQFAKRNYIKVSGNRVVVVSGRRGMRFVRGGASLIVPFLERMDELDLTSIIIDNLIVKDAITKEGVPLTIKAVASVKIGSEEPLLFAAQERLLGMTRDSIKKMAYETLEGHLRSMLSTLTVGEINSDRAKFSESMMKESATDLAKLGLKIDILTIKEVSDDVNYLKSLGLKRTAEVKRDAEVGAAEAQREAMEKATTAQRAGEVTKQENLAQEAEAEAAKNIRIAEARARTSAQAAKADQAGPLATAEARVQVVEAEQAVELRRTQKATEVAQAEAARKRQELQATTVAQAEADREAAIARANGEAEAVRIKAEAERLKLTAEGEGKAAAIRAALLAEAEGIERKAEAYEKLNATPAGQLLQVLEAVQTLGPNMVKEFAGVMEAAVRPLGNIDNLVVVDSGGGLGGGDNAMSRLVQTVPGLVFGFVEKAKAMGYDVAPLLGKAGLTLTAPAGNGHTDPPSNLGPGEHVGPVMGGGKK